MESGHDTNIDWHFAKNDSPLSIAFYDGNIDNILQIFGIDKCLLEETIKNNYKNFIQFKANNQNDLLEKLIMDILKNKDVPIHYQINTVFTIENLSSFSIKDKSKLQEITK